MHSLWSRFFFGKNGSCFFAFFVNILRTHRRFQTIDQVNLEIVLLVSFMVCNPVCTLYVPCMYPILSGYHGASEWRDQEQSICPWKQWRWRVNWKNWRKRTGINKVIYTWKPVILNFLHRSMFSKFKVRTCILRTLP